jgi:hypothetical protein
MANTYTWTVTAMDCYPQEDGNTDVVFTVHWTCSGTDGTYYGSVYSTCSVPSPTGSFTPYADLTQEQVLGWCYANGVDKTATETSIQASIDNQINPPIIQPPLPWANPLA